MRPSRVLAFALLAAPAGCSDHGSTPDAAPADAASEAARDASPMDATLPDAPLDDASDAAPADVAPDAPPVLHPRQLAPLSTATVTSHRPTLRFLLPVGTTSAHVDLCATRACDAAQTTLDTGGTSVAPASDLAPGVYYWRVRAGADTTPVWQFTVGARSAPVDTSWGVVSDPNGDGHADLVVGASHAAVENGRVYLYPGSASGTASTAAAALMPPATGPIHFGWAAGSAGDVNGDGFADLLVSAPDSDSSAGRAYLFLGGAAGVASAPVASPRGPDSNGVFGTALAGVGDANGDGYADVVVGAPNVQSSTGKALVFYGRADGIGETPDQTLVGPDGPGGAFGTALAGVGDVNGDGYADLVVGALGAANNAGRAYVYYGSPHGFAQAPDLALPSPTTENGQFGSAVSSAGDVNGDGFADVAIGAPGTLNGDVWVYPGARAGLGTTPIAALEGPDGQRGNFGWSVAGAGDTDGDGFGDLVVGAVCVPFTLDPNGGYPTCGPGRIYLYPGSAAGLAAAPTFTADGPAGEPAAFGWALAAGSDVDGDGRGDLAVGADAVANYAGAVMVYASSATGFSQTPSVTLAAPDGAGGNFGWVLGF